MICSVASGGFLVPVDPGATYLRTSPLDPYARNTVPIDLFSFNLYPGDLIRLERVGAYNPFGQFNLWPPSDTFEDMIGVFSSSPDLLPTNLVNRVAGAIDAGTDVDTYVTWGDNLPRDINEDFWISSNSFWTGSYPDHSATLNIPTSARYLFVSALDSFYGDNDDPNGDYAVFITAVPEPSGIAVWAGTASLVLFAAIARAIACSSTSPDVKSV